MEDDDQRIFEPKTQELDAASRPDIRGFLFRCYCENKSVDEAIADCKRLGAEDDKESVESIYEELSQLAQWWRAVSEAYQKLKAQSTTD